MQNAPIDYDSMSEEERLAMYEQDYVRAQADWQAHFKEELRRGALLHLTIFPLAFLVFAVIGTRSEPVLRTALQTQALFFAIGVAFGLVLLLLRACMAAGPKPTPEQVVGLHWIRKSWQDDQRAAQAAQVAQPAQPDATKG